MNKFFLPAQPAGNGQPGFSCCCCTLQGDALITTCWYKTMDRDNITLGGFAISDEMCVNYVHYYPKIDLEVCKSSVSSEGLQTYFRFLHE